MALAAAGSAAPKAGAAPSTGTPTQFGSSASKLGDYLTANAPQIQNQANTISNGLNQQFANIGTDISNAANQFGQQVSSGYTAGNQDVVNQAAYNPTQFASDPNNVNAFQAQYNDTYTGPQNYESTTPYSNVQNEVSSAVQNAGLLNTPTGLASYFGSQGNNPTQASNTLDSLLINGNPQAQQQIQQAAGQFQNLTPQFQNSVTQADQLVPAAQQAAQQAQQYAQSQIGNTVDQFGNTLNTQLTGANNAQNQYNQNLSQAQSDATGVNSALQQFLGTVPNSGIQNYYSPVLSMTPGVNPATLADTANAGQYGEDAALQQLIGSSYNPLLNQANVNQAGTFQAPNAAIPSANSLLQQQDQALANYYVNNPNLFNANQGNNSPAQSFSALASYLQSLDPTQGQNTQNEGSEGNDWYNAFQNANSARK